MRIRTPALCSLAAAALALTAARKLRTVEVTGDSMLPTLHPGDWLLIHKGAQPTPGALVVAHHPQHQDLLIIKRATHQTPEGWWLESDNQQAPGRQDSWTFGPVPTALIVGQVLTRYWPLRAPHLPHNTGQSPAVSEPGNR